METDRFNFLTRSLTGATRRRFSLALAGLGLAGGLGLLTLPDKVTGKKKCKRKRKGKRCKIIDKPKCGSGEKPCVKSCIPEADCCTDEDCATSLGEICVDGDCVCGTRRGLSIQAC
jgi:hypothetical protein